MKSFVPKSVISQPSLFFLISSHSITLVSHSLGVQKAKGGRKNHPGSDEDYKKHVARNSTKADEHHHKSSPFNRQGYDDRLDESLAKDGKESSKKQSMKDRRDESKGMEKSKGKGAYSSDPKMS